MPHVQKHLGPLRGLTFCSMDVCNNSAHISQTTRESRIVVKDTVAKGAKLGLQKSCEKTSRMYLQQSLIILFKCQDSTPLTGTK